MNAHPMISIATNTKILGSAKEKLPDKSLWEFLSEDPKRLAYLFSGYAFSEDHYEKYNIDPEIFEFVKNICDYNADEVHENYQSPEKLIKQVELFQDLEKSKLDQIINDFLNPELISPDKAMALLSELQNYLDYQKQRGAVVLFAWA